MSLSRKRFVLVFEFHDEEEVRIDNSSDEKHRIWNTPFVESLVELKEEEELDDDDNYADGMTIVIPLSKTIKRSSLIDFLDFLLYSAGDHKIGIGIHSQLTYRQVYKNHPGYYQWAHDHKDSCDDSQRYVDWVNFCRGGKRHPNPQEMVPIAKFFQIDVCARCGVLRLLSRQNFHPCRRTKWPRLPTNVPEFNSVTNGASDVHQAWKEAWEVAENDRKTSGRVVCCNDDLVCDDCFPSQSENARIVYSRFICAHAVESLCVKTAGKSAKYVTERPVHVAVPVRL
ncbi:hypothetical protein IV203_029365 [Nitzschia inconspicua]|uniref:Uncharacterized protein n=1 Tax=Nitzschia inconspicua TaxID=303405 RepID=A0A9K3LQG5_9STRA|nr:hypothetical protein IV203_029365 [Nitzschia inconspicua]